MRTTNVAGFRPPGAPLVTGLMFAATLGLAGCQITGGFDWQSNTGGTGGSPPIAGTGGAPSCDEDCVDPPEGWSPPSLFAVGPFGSAAGCPWVAPEPGIEAYGDLQAAPAVCPVCQCGDSETDCTVPTDWHASAADCAGAEGAQATPFDGPPDWDGSCSAGAIAAGALCGGVPCVQSLTVAPPSVTAGACAPEAAGRQVAPQHAWGLRARECLPEKAGTCPEEPGRCFPPAGFSLCVHRAGVENCPSPYLNQRVFYQEVEDTRACSTCTCSAPEGNACTVLATAFQDGACGAIAGALLVTSASGDGCVDVPPGLALGGKTAEVVSAGAGSCAPGGGEPVGRVTPVHPITVCCREELVAR